MIASETLFQIEPKYCIDTNVIVSFLSESDDEYYGADIFPDHWQQIATMIASGRIVAPRQVENELNGHAKKRPKIGPWLNTHRYMFRDVETDAQLVLAKQIVNKYPPYMERTRTTLETWRSSPLQARSESRLSPSRRPSRRLARSDP